MTSELKITLLEYRSKLWHHCSIVIIDKGIIYDCNIFTVMLWCCNRNGQLELSDMTVIVFIEEATGRGLIEVFEGASF